MLRLLSAVTMRKAAGHTATARRGGAHVTSACAVPDSEGAAPPLTGGGGDATARQRACIAQAALSVLALLRTRRTAGGTLVGCQVRALCRPQPGRAGATRERHGAYSSLHDRDTPLTAHTRAAGCGPSAGRCRGGQTDARAARGVLVSP